MRPFGRIRPYVRRLEHREGPLTGDRAPAAVRLHDLEPKGALSETGLYQQRNAVTRPHGQRLGREGSLPVGESRCQLVPQASTVRFFGIEHASRNDIRAPFGRTELFLIREKRYVRERVTADDRVRRGVGRV